VKAKKKLLMAVSKNNSTKLTNPKRGEQKEKHYGQVNATTFRTFRSVTGSRQTGLD